MGIDKPVRARVWVCACLCVCLLYIGDHMQDVRKIIHYGMTKSVEEYYQQTLTLPLYYELEMHDVERVVETLKKFLKEVENIEESEGVLSWVIETAGRAGNLCLYL